MQGQANHFVRYAPEKIEYAQQRYVNETKRLYSVLEMQLRNADWLAAQKYTIADIANFSWVTASSWAGVDLNEFPKLKVESVFLQCGEQVCNKWHICSSCPADMHKLLNFSTVLSKCSGIIGMDGAHTSSKSCEDWCRCS